MPKNTFVRYLLVGGTGYIVEMGALYVLHYVCNLSSFASAAVSFWIGFVVAFVLQKLVTFKNFERRPETVARQILFYSLLTGWNYLFTLVLVKLFAGHTSVLVVRTVAIAIITLWNFVVYKRFFQGHPEMVVVE